MDKFLLTILFCNMAAMACGCAFVETKHASVSIDLAPWGSNTHPHDVRKTHIETIEKKKHVYSIVQAGTMDGTNCASPLGCGQSNEGVFEQVWVSNRKVRLENVGRTTVVNPWLSNGRNDYRSVSDIVAAATTADMTPREKAISLWWQQVQRRYHFHGKVDNEELSDVVKVFNVYGHNTCGNDSICLATLWKHAGLRVAPGHAVLHCVSQAHYDHDWHLFDGDMHAIYLRRDNITVASEQDLMRDHDLIKRSHTQGILFPDTPSSNEVTAAMYIYEGSVTGTRGININTTMAMTLRPYEALTWRWGHLTPPKIQGGGSAKYPEAICNGLWEYRPDFTDALWRKGVDSLEQILITGDGLAAVPGQQGTVIWRMHSPYVFVGGRLDVEGSGAEFAISFDQKIWVKVAQNLDPVFAMLGPGRYEYYLRCTLKGSARLRNLAIINDLQMAPLALPGMRIGENRFVYSDETPGQRQVAITHTWVERSLSRAPLAPTAALTPRDGGKSLGTGIVFRWEPAADPDGREVVDYHFELSSRTDMAWPLSMSFAKLISRTMDKGKAQYTLPQSGLLNPGTKYYWRVRAKNSVGIWGPWSKIWTFTAGGPGIPRDVKAKMDSASGQVILRWTANPQGNVPARYRVYGSNEKGFTISDLPYERVEQVNVDKGRFDKTFVTVPANFISETTATGLSVLGPGVATGNTTFYRVVAVDEAGRRSGPSDYAEAPRPVIYSMPTTQVRLGEVYHYSVRANHSLGDLRLGTEKLGRFWHAETCTYELREGPEWLNINSDTGLLSGTPLTLGRFRIIVTATLREPVWQIDESALKWGNLKITEETTKVRGPATQTFTLTVGDGVE